MKRIKGIEINSLEVVIKGIRNRNTVDLGAVTLSVAGREFILDVVQSFTDITEDKDGIPMLNISCVVEPDEDTFDDCPYNLKAEDLLNADKNGLVKTLYVGGEEYFDVVSIVLNYEYKGENYQLEIDEE